MIKLSDMTHLRCQKQLHIRVLTSPRVDGKQAQLGRLWGLTIAVLLLSGQILNLLTGFSLGTRG